jgi:hypothetical protein
MVPHIVKMASESRNAFARPNRSGGDLTRNISRRLERLETRAKEVAAARPEPHTFCFIEPNWSQETRDTANSPSG